MELLNPLSPYKAHWLFYSKDRYRSGVLLLSTLNPRVYKSPELFQYDPSAVAIEVFHNGRGLFHSPTESPKDGDFYVEESVPGAGYDQIVLVSFTPDSRSTLRANYFVST